MTAEDLIELRDFGTISYGPGREPFSLSPDGRYAALTLRRADVETDSYCVGIVLVPLDGRGSARLLDVGGSVIGVTNDVHRVAAIPNGLALPAAPVWSADSKSVAFLRKDGPITQIWEVGLDGAPARQVSRLSTDPLDLAPGPDPYSVVFTTRPLAKLDPAEIEREGRSGYLFDDRFWVIADMRPHARASVRGETMVLDLRSGAVRRLSDAEAAALASPGGKPPPKDADAHAEAGGDRAYVAPERADRPRDTTLLRVERGGNEVPCTAVVCREPIVDLFWEKPGVLLILRSPTPDNGGRNALYRWDVRRGGQPVRLLETEDWLTGCRMAASTMICAREGLNQPRALVRVDLRTGGRTTIYEPNPEYARLRLGHAERIAWTDRDGVRTYGDMVLPPSHQAGQRHPLIVVQYWSRGFLRGGIADEFPIQMMAARGYAVLSFQMPSQSPAEAAQTDGLSAQRAKVKDWAGRARIFTAMDAGIDAVIARGVVDPDVIGITGISDGASTVQFALNNSSRFKAAVIGGCCDEPSATFTVGPGYSASTAAYGYPKPGDDGRAFWRRQSLAQNADHLRVPLLMQPADNETRMALETYSALKSHGVPVEMYVFPDEWHTKFHPAHRKAIYLRGVAWLDFWLRGAVDPDRPEEIARWQAMRDQLVGSAPAP